MEGLWPADFEKSEEENGRGRNWTNHENCGWKAGSNGFERVADRMVEKLELEGDEDILCGVASGKVEVYTKDIGSKDMSKEKQDEIIKDISMVEDYDLAFLDGTKLEYRKTGAG